MTEKSNESGHDLESTGPVCEPVCESEPPVEQLVQAGPDVTECFREARRRLEARDARDERGRFVTGNTEAGQTLSRSEQLWALVEPVRLDLLQRVRADLGVEDDDAGANAAETLLGTVDSYVQARLLRESMWAYLVDRGGPITPKGNKRRALAAFWDALRAERQLAQDIGLERRARQVDPLEAVRAAVAEANR